jgi:hypothetical protein
MIHRKRNKGPIMKKLKVKILGYGNAAKKHREAYESLPSLFQVIENGYGADIMDICTPNYLHYEHTVSALEEGFVVIVEKPIAGSLAEVDKLMELDDRRGRIFPISQYRYMPVDASDYFTLIDIRQPRDDNYYKGWRGDRTKSFGGCMTMFGIHIFDMLSHITRVSRVVYAKTDNSHHALDVEDSCVVVLEMADGGVSTVYIETPSTCDPTFIINGRKVETNVSLFAEQFDDIHSAITNKKPAHVTLQDARNAIEILTAAYYLAESEIPNEIWLPITEDHSFYKGWL